MSKALADAGSPPAKVQQRAPRTSALPGRFFDLSSDRAGLLPRDLVRLEGGNI